MLSNEYLRGFKAARINFPGPTPLGAYDARRGIARDQGTAGDLIDEIRRVLGEDLGVGPTPSSHILHQ